MDLIKLVVAYLIARACVAPSERAGLPADELARMKQAAEIRQIENSIRAERYKALFAAGAVLASLASVIIGGATYLVQSYEAQQFDQKQELIATLANLNKTGRADIQQDAAFMLRLFGREAVPHLVGHLNVHHEPIVRGALLNSLKDIANEANIETAVIDTVAHAAETALERGLSSGPAIEAPVLYQYILAIDEVSRLEGVPTISVCRLAELLGKYELSLSGHPTLDDAQEKELVVHIGRARSEIRDRAGECNDASHPE